MQASDLVHCSLCYPLFKSPQILLCYLSVACSQFLACFTVQFSRCRLPTFFKVRLKCSDSCPNTSIWSWWRLPDSNRWPPACKAGALPAELNPHVLCEKAVVIYLSHYSLYMLIFFCKVLFLNFFWIFLIMIKKEPFIKALFIIIFLYFILNKPFPFHCLIQCLRNYNFLPNLFVQSIRNHPLQAHRIVSMSLMKDFLLILNLWLICVLLNF